MTRRRKFALGFLSVLTVGIGVCALVLSHDAPCTESPPLPAGIVDMKAATYRCYGSSDVVKVERVAKPEPAADEILIKVEAASVNPLDWHYLHGKPYILRLGAGIGRPDDTSIGVDFAGTVEAIGSAVTRFKPGDEVFGGASGTFAEYVTMPESRGVAHKPDNLSFAQVAAVPIAAITALQALRDQGQLQAGQSVLINGASGGVGTFAVQIARHFGAEVTGVCSTRNLAMVRELGAEHVIDYTREDFTEGTQQYDVIIDLVANHDLLDIRRALKPAGILVMVGGGGPDSGPWIEPFMNPIKAALLTPYIDQPMKFFIARFNPEDLQLLSRLMAEGEVTPVVEQHYSLDRAVEAMARVEAGHARGKVIITME
ncbi:NAD(P)-dependent alcohol dehydrogenase [Dokdonella sp.]|uniref:NAD(P)-dependent alcohol dehydrogenase n=1 Tax=Dokdonella sp. TaxID=2291710 RepID=UPI003C417B38